MAANWGTSSLRGAWLAARGQAAEERSFAHGILTVTQGEFPTVFEACFGDWMKAPDALCLMVGMVGSKQGWLAGSSLLHLSGRVRRSRVQLGLGGACRRGHGARTLLFTKMLPSTNSATSSERTGRMGLGYSHRWLPGMEPEPHDIPRDARLKNECVVWPV